MVGIRASTIYSLMKNMLIIAHAKYIKTHYLKLTGQTKSIRHKNYLDVMLKALLHKWMLLRIKVCFGQVITNDQCKQAGEA